jgi:two-component sensor histidine kinase
MLTRFWNFISRIGIKENYDAGLVKRVKLANQFNLVAIIVFFFSGINNYELGDAFSASLIWLFMILSMFSFYLNKKQFHRSAFRFLYTLISIAIFYFDSYSGLLSGTYLYYFPLVLAIAFLFDVREDKKNMFFHFLLIIVFFTTNALTHHRLFESDFLTQDKRNELFIFNFLLSVFAVGFFIYLIVQNNLREIMLYNQRISDKEKSEAIIKTALAEKDILMAELHHRVKNNLAIISGLFSLKITDNLNSEARNVLIESRDRVRSMSLIHNRLYKSCNLLEVNFEEYIKELVAEINSSYPNTSSSISISTFVNDVSLNINHAVPCGLILNELLTNCYKHAFKNRSEGHIDITFVNDNAHFKMQVKDDGVGLPKDYNKRSSLGVTVIESLSEQLDGNCCFKNDGGTVFELTFKTTK